MHVATPNWHVRVSYVRGRTGGSFISPAVQRESIERWCKANGAVLGHVFEELDESGGRQDRPLLLEALSRIESGFSQGLVVEKLDRFGRSLIHSLLAIERIRAAGGTFVSVADGFDLSTETGKYVLGILLSTAELELDRVRANWEVATRRAIARGIYVGGTIPTGYVRDRRTRRLRPHPTLGPLVTELFERRAGGESIRALCRLCEERGVRTAQGNTTWIDGTMRKMLRNRIYLGEVHRGDLVNPSAHPPLIDAPTFQRAQNPRITATTRGFRHGPSLLGGLARCAGCRMVMASGWVTDRSGRRVRTYSCLTRRAYTSACPAPASIRAPVIEPHVEAIFWRLLGHAKGRSTGGIEHAERRSDKPSGPSSPTATATPSWPRSAPTASPPAYAIAHAKSTSRCSESTPNTSAPKPNRDPTATYSGNAGPTWTCSSDAPS
jgi:site-specific DNA recombinase